MKLDRTPGILDRDHRNCVIWHALERLKHRCRVIIDRDTYTALCEHIRRGFAGEPVAFSDDGCPIFAVTIQGEDVYAIYVPEHELVCTFLGDLWHRQAVQLVEGVTLQC